MPKTRGDFSCKKNKMSRVGKKIGLGFAEIL